MKKIKGFTLIELLIVVAIIAILAAIAVPNFLEAQVRSKVSRGKADMRAMATAMESYKIDTNKYPPDAQFYNWGNPPRPVPATIFFPLTSPVAYLTTIPKNVFVFKAGPSGGWHDGDPKEYQYKAQQWHDIMVAASVLAGSPLLGPDGKPDYNSNGQWVLYSVGPDSRPSCGEYDMFGEKVINRCSTVDPKAGNPGAIYDATNGTVSNGDIVRVGP